MSDFNIWEEAQKNLTIRRMRPEDLTRVLFIDQQSFTVPWPRNAYEYELFENPNSLLLVAEVNPEAQLTEVVGMIVLWIIVDEMHIATLAVLPEFRRMGIAKNLIRSSLTEAQEYGTTTATLEVREGNLAAQNLYHSLGFEIVGRRKRYYRNNHEDAIIMTLNCHTGASPVSITDCQENK